MRCPMTGRFYQRCVLVMAAASMLSACSDILGPGIPDGAVVLAPLPAEFEGWWSITESCAGLQGALEDVEWRIMPGDRQLSDEGALGRYIRRSHAIVLADGWERNGYLVRHEMLHALLALYFSAPDFAGQ